MPTPEEEAAAAAQNRTLTQTVKPVAGQLAGTTAAQTVKPVGTVSGPVANTGITSALGSLSSSLPASTVASAPTQAAVPSTQAGQTVKPVGTLSSAPATNTGISNAIAPLAASVPVTVGSTVGGAAGMGSAAAPGSVTQSPTDALLSGSINPVTPTQQYSPDAYINIARPDNYVLGGDPNYAPALSAASQDLARGAATQQAQVGNAQLGLAAESQTAGEKFANKLASQGAAMGTYAGEHATNINRQASNIAGMGNQVFEQGAEAAGRAGPVADFSAQTGALNQSQSATDQLLALETKQGPSAAQAQMQLGLNAAADANTSLARSGRGWGQSASALAQAGRNNAAMGANVASQAAMLRAQEDAAARQRAASNLATAGGLQQAAAQQFGTQAQANVQNALQAQQLNDAASQNLYNTALQAQQIAGNQQVSAAQLGLGGLQAGAQTVAQAGQMDLAGLGQAGQLTAQDGQDYSLGAQQQQNALTYSAQLAQQQLAASQAYEQARLQEYGIRKGVAIQQAANTQNMSGAGLAAVGTALSSDIRGKDRIKPMSAVEALLSPGDSLLDKRTGEELDEEEDPYQLGYAKPSRAVDAVAADAGAIRRSRETVGSSTYGGPDLDQMASHMEAGAKSMGAGLAGRAVNGKRKAIGNAMSAAGKGFMRNRPVGLDFINQYVTSDEDEKTDLRPARGYSYEYKDPEKNGRGRFYGPMAQDLLKTPAGRSAVVRQPDGSLGVDTGRLSLTNTSAIGEQQRRQDYVDERVSALEQLLAEEPPRRARKVA